MSGIAAGVAKLRALGLTLRLDRAGRAVAGPKGAITPEMRYWVLENNAAVAALLRAEAEAPNEEKEERPPAPAADPAARRMPMPNTTQVPDVLFDVWLPQLGDAELRVLLYIIRRTFGFKKHTDPISYRQFLEGITTKEGTRIDRGCIRNRTNLSRALKSLEAKGLIRAVKAKSGAGDAAITVYEVWLSEAEEGR